MTEFFQYLITGVTIGFMYGLVALGYTVIYNATKIINFAQGEFLMLGGMTTVFLFNILPLPLAIMGGLLVAVFSALILERAITLSKGHSGVVNLIILTLGFALFIRGLAQVLFDKQLHSFTGFKEGKILNFWGLTIIPHNLLMIALSIIMVVGLYLFFNKTKSGKAMIAVSENKEAAKIMGISITKILILNFTISALTSAGAGIILTPIAPTHFEVGILFGLKGFCAMVLGGLGNPFGSVLGGVILGIAESSFAGYVSSQYKDAFAFLLLLIILIIKPMGFNFIFPRSFGFIINLYKKKQPK